MKAAILIILPTVLTMTACGSNSPDPNGGGVLPPSAEGFFDDYSADSLRLTVDRRTDERVTRSYAIENDRVVVTAAATSEEEQGEAELDAWGRSDSITARVSLSSDSELPTNDEAQSSVRIAGTFYNDVQDGGFDDRVGDVFVQLRLRLRGDGRRDASFCIDRGTTEGSEPVNIVDGDSCGSFDGFVPALDTEYTLSTTLDRDVGTLGSGSTT